METLALLCGGDEMKAELWEELGTSLGMSKEQLEKISVEEGDNLEKCKQCVLNVWVSESEEVTWKRLAEALEAIEGAQLANKIREEYCVPEDSNNSEEKISSRFFSVPPHTPVILSEAGDCGTTMIRVSCKDMAGTHETRHLNNYCPVWVMDIVCQKKLPDSIKLNFFLCEAEDPKSPKSDRLSAQDLLTIRKVQEYVYDKLYGDKGEEAGKDGRGGNLEITCAEQVLDPELDLRSVKHSVWKSGGDMKLFFKKGSKDKQELSADSANEQEEAAASADHALPPDIKE